MIERIFLYGTLLPDHAPAEIADIAQRLRPVGRAFVRGRLYDLGEYPGAILDPSSDTMIVGKVFELPDDRGMPAKLDWYEGFDPSEPDGSLFVRMKSSVTLDEGGELQCWIYVYNREPGEAPLMADGKYSQWKESEGVNTP